jgi:cytochrome c oxidase cbb3-type subunit 3
MVHRHKLLLMALAGLVLLGIACGAYVIQENRYEVQLLRADPDALPPGLLQHAIARGAGIFRSNCATCHGADGHGDASLGVPNLTDRDWLYGTGRVGDIGQTIRYGIRAQDSRGRKLADMPAYSHPRPYAREDLPPLSPDDIQDVVQFLMRLQGRTAQAEAAARGDRIFHTRGGCWDCHGQDGRGDNEVGSPDLAARTWLYGNGSAADIFRSIADGHAGVCPAWVNRLSEREILETAAYVWSQGGGS